MMYGGFNVTLDQNMLDWHVDWSLVRSHSRARRRMRRGFKQNIRRVSTPKKEAYKIGDRLVMHPAMWEQLKKHTLPMTDEFLKANPQACALL
jgi:hypothetical protein